MLTLGRYVADRSRFPTVSDAPPIHVLCYPNSYRHLVHNFTIEPGVGKLSCRSRGMSALTGMWHPASNDKHDSADR